MPKRKESAGGRAGGKRAATQGLANQALTSLVTLVTQGVMEALAEQCGGHGPSALDLRNFIVGDVARWAIWHVIAGMILNAIDVRAGGILLASVPPRSLLI